MTIGSRRLRQDFLQFFSKNHHVIEKSAPLSPHDDPSLLFVNAGMVPFKNVFTQKETRPYKRACSSQKCVRAGGKHNDLENVGETARHHTFFEMLGNFSFGDYFKEEAISFAWQFLTKELGLDQSRLSVSVFAGDAKTPPDTDAENIWHKKVGLPKDRIKRLGRADNFWQMGDVGPCGPCTEIYYDRKYITTGFGSDNPDDQVIEIWNLVFMQYEMMPDGSMRPLPAPCVDTGMGLERLASVVNHLPSNYDTDLLRPLIHCAELISKKTYQSSRSADDMAMRVIADHARACAFLIADGLFPSNEGRGYVLRRFMRRAIRHGAHLGLTEPFFHHVCLEVAKVMGDPYRELIEAQALIEKVVSQEEATFRKTLERGLSLFFDQTKYLNPGDKLDGDVVFRLYETYGFPADLTEDLAKEKKLAIDWNQFAKAEKEHLEKSSQGLGLKGVNDLYLHLKERVAKTIFSDDKQLDNLKVLALIKDDQEIAKLQKGDTGVVIFDKTPFYGESGGQIGDTGSLSAPNFKATVIDTKKVAGLNLHIVKIDEGNLSVSQSIHGAIDWERRQAIRRNHSATHLLHSALRQVLGSHVIQKGSLVAPDRLRFDFAHFEAMSKEQWQAVEKLVNNWILANEPAKVQEMTMEEAKSYGALALFGEKYESKVRVLDMGSHSTELCGGTHCHRTGDIGAFLIISESPLAQGIRRIEAITGEAVIAHSNVLEQLKKDISLKLGVKSDEILLRLDHLLKELKESAKARKSNTTASLKDRADDAIRQAKNIGDIQFVHEIVKDVDDAEALRTYADLLRDRMKSGVVSLGLIQEDKCVLLIAATKDLAQKVHAGKIVAQVAPIIGGKGGGRPDFAQAGGLKSASLNDAFIAIEEILKQSF
jgi:alanyl-tRNA synthetase